MHQLDAELDDNQLQALIDGLIAALKPHAISSDWDSALSLDTVETRAEWALNFLISILLSKVGPDPFETHGDRLLRSWTREDGDVKAPTLSLPELAGIYKSISEACWTKTLVLTEDGTGTVEHIWWTYEETADGLMSRVEASTSRTISWTIQGRLVEIAYDSVLDRLCFDPAMSLSELGLLNGFPGLSQVQPWSESSLIRGATLWKMPHDFWPKA